MWRASFPDMVTEIDTAGPLAGAAIDRATALSGGLIPI
jgi:hypothetical protein